MKDNFINKINKINEKSTNIAIFDEEFDAKLIANRSKPADFLTEDLLEQKLNNDEATKLNTKSLYISQKDLATVFDENPGLKLLTKDASGEFVEIGDVSDFTNNNLIFSNSEVEAVDTFIEINVPTHSKETEDNQSNSQQKKVDTASGFAYIDYDDDDYNLTEEETQELARKENLRKKLTEEAKKFEEDKYILPTDNFLLQNKANFSDYIAAQVISGSKAKKYSENYIPEEFVDKSTIKKIEVVDLDTFAGKDIKKTSVFINRNADGDIESLEVLCKCGERTLINFDFNEDDEDAIYEATENTLVVVDALPEKLLDINDAELKADIVRKQVLKEDEVADEISNDIIKIEEE